MIENATLEGVKSGDIDLSLGVNAEGDEGGDVDVKLSGPFEAGAKGELPQLELSAEANGSVDSEDLDFEGGLTLLTDRAFVDYEGHRVRSRPDHLRLRQVGASNRPSSRRRRRAATSPPARRRPKGLKVGDFVDNLDQRRQRRRRRHLRRPRSAATSTSPAAIDAIIKLTEDPACSSQLEAAGPLPLGELEEAKGELTKAVKNAHVDVYVGDDDIVRKVDAELTIEPPGAADEKVEVDIELTLCGVNEEQSISTPVRREAARRPLPEARRQPARTARRRGSGEGLGGLLEGVLGGGSQRRRFFLRGGSAGGASSERARRRPAGLRGMPAGSRNAGRPAEVREPARIAG